MSPKGKVLTQAKVKELSKENRLIILCGHYEGIDQRVIDEIVDEEISIGDYVLTGGELPAMCLIDSVWSFKWRINSWRVIFKWPKFVRISSIYKTNRIQRKKSSWSACFRKSSRNWKVEERAIINWNI